MLTSLFFPLLWLPSINIGAKCVTVVLFFIMCVANVNLALKTFDAKWNAVGIARFEKVFKSNGVSPDWDKILYSMNLSVSIFVPGKPGKMTDVLAIILFLLLMAGYMLRKVDPVLSMAALVLPNSVGAACVLQLSGYRLAEARIVKMLEQKKNVRLLSSS